MMNFSWLAILIVTCASLKAGLPPPDSETSPHIAKSSARIRLVPVDKENRGPARIGRTVSRRFLIENTGSTDARLSVAARSCGCLKVLFGQDTLRAGGSTTCEVQATILGGIGFQRMGATLQLTTIAEPSASDQVIATIGFTPDREFEVLPAELFINAIAGQAIASEIRVVRVTPIDLPITSVDVNADWLTVGAAVPQSNAPHVQVLPVTVKPLAPGVHTAWVTLHVASDSVPTVTVPVRIRVADALVCNVGGLVLRNGQNGPSSAVCQLLLRSKAVKHPATVELVGLPPWLSVTLKDAGSHPHPAWEVVATAAADAPPGTFASGTVVVRDAAGTQLAHIPIVRMAD